MKKGINLLHVQEKYKKYYRAFAFIKIFSGIIVVVFFIFLLGFFLALDHKNKEYQRILSERVNTIGYLRANQHTEAEFVLFGNKLIETNMLLKEDANFYPYYNILNQSLQQASEEARFRSIHIDKDKNVNFVIELPSYEKLLAFFKFIESDIFLDKFDELVLSQLDLTELQDAYQLSFSGKFKDIDEIQN